MQPLSKSSNFRRIAWQLGLIAIVLIAWRLISKARQPEQIAFSEAILHAPHFIKQGEIFWISTDQGHSAIRARPMAGGAERLVVQNPPDIEMMQYSGFLLFTNDMAPYYPHLQFTGPDVFYQVRPKPKQSHPQMATGAGAVTPDRYLGRFRPGHNKPVSGETRRTYRGAPSIYYSLRSAPRTGGTSREVSGVEANTIHIIGDWIYWLKQGPFETTIVTRKNQYYTEAVGHDQLMVTSLKTGETHQLAADMDDNTYLIPGAEGVYWVEPRPFPDQECDLYYACVTTPRTLVIPDFRSNGVPLSDKIAEYQGRLYWVQPKTPPSNQHPFSMHPLPPLLVSATPGGSDKKIVLDLEKENLLLDYPPQVHQGSLYFVAHRALPSEQSKGQQELRLVCRLHPERADPIEIIRSLEKSARGNYICFDDGYCYYSTTETIRPLWDILTGDETHSEPVERFFRFRLPR